MGIMDVLNVLGGVGLFLYGIKLMSEALQSIAGDKMRQLMGTIAKTPLRGVFIGALVTVLIQSSAGATVMTVSFVNAGLLTLKQAIGIIMGANVGTTITAQIIAFSIESFALPLIALGAVLAIFCKKSKRAAYLGNGIIGLSLLFLGMGVMKSSTHLMSGQRELLLLLSSNPILGIISGMILTILIQSSAATIGLTIALASQGLLTLDAAIPIILGDNIGTTFTALLSAIGANRSAKQAAAAHMLFNLLGVIIFSLAFPLYKGLVVLTADTVGRQIANAHLIFNILNTIIFFPFIPFLAALIEKIIPSEVSALQDDLKYLNNNLISASATAAVSAVKDELLYMGGIVKLMFNNIKSAYGLTGLETDENNNNLSFDDIFEEFEDREKRVNAINRAIASYASEIWQQGLGSAASKVLGCYVSAASDIERVGDHSENLMELCNSLKDYMSGEARGEFQDMFGTCEKAFNMALESLEHEDIHLANTVIYELESKIDAQEEEYRQNHIDRLNKGECDPEKGVNFIDILGNLERIGDHSDNIAGYTLDIKINSKPKTSHG
ncbi:MAG: Na/Pi cotransporter family protein [Synergistaceae bacterium]|nr:Na/Pi cotransporter family protein [Synergistaceae bacterium]